MKYLLILLILPVVFSCKKDDSSGECKISSVSYNFGPGPEVLTASYKNGRMIEMSSAKRKFVYTYDDFSRLKEIVFFYVGGPQAQYKTTFSYDARGNLTEKVKYRFSNGTFLAESRYTYQYLDDKRHREYEFLLSGASLVHHQTIEYDWTGNNITKLSYFSPAGTLDCQILYFFDMTSKNVFYTNFNDYFLKEIYSDITSVFYLSENRLVSNTDCSMGQMEQWTYTYNSKGFPKTVTYNDNRNPPFDYWTFAYSCD